MNPTEALAQIEALCDFRSGHKGAVPVADVRAVLAQVQPEPVTYPDPNDGIDQWTVGDWARWSNAVAECIPESEFGDVDQETGILDWVRWKAQVQPEPVALDHDKAREVLGQIGAYWEGADPVADKEEALDMLAACVRPAPPQAIDRDALSALLSEYPEHNTYTEHDALLADIIALLRPVEGVVLTREEVTVALKWHNDAKAGMREDYELVTRLEAAS